jgi:hypothetical protein
MFLKVSQTIRKRKNQNFNTLFARFKNDFEHFKLNICVLIIFVLLCCIYMKV